MVWDHVPLSEGPRIVDINTRLQNQWFQTIINLQVNNNSLRFRIDACLRNLPVNIDIDN